MRFGSVEIRNFRGIRHFAVSDLRDTVVLAGPNGCGKSGVLDALRLLKSLYGGYSSNELQQWFGEFQISLRDISDFRRLLRDDQQPLVVQAEVQLAESETTYLRENAMKVLTPIVWGRMLGQDLDLDVLGVMFGQAMQQRQAEFAALLGNAVVTLHAELAHDRFLAGISVDPGGALTIQEHLPLRALFHTYDPVHLGVVDYHSPSRSYDREVLGGVNLNLDAMTAQRRQYSLYNWREKYKNVKSELAAHYVRGMISDRAGSGAKTEDLNATLSTLFKTFFPDKSYDGPVAQPDGTVTFPVRLPNGRSHDIDDLSSGEKELLYGYLRLRNSAPKNSVILLDEPELHLNPRLLQGMPDFYHEHLGRALGSQLWLVTHSDAILRQAVGNPLFSTYHMTAASLSEEDNQAIAVEALDELDRALVDIVGDLAAYRPLAKVVILEGGGETEIDVHIVGRLFPEFAQRVNLVPGGAKQRVRDLYGILQTTAQRAQLGHRFFAITDRDRDFTSTAEATVLRWDRYHIENYLLEPAFIYQVTQAIAAPGSLPPSVADTKARLKEAAAGLVGRVVLQRLQAEVNDKLIRCIDIGADPYTSTPAEDLLPSIDGSLTRFTLAAGECMATSWLKDREAVILQELAEALSTDEWMAVFPGRSVLAAYVGRQVTGVNYEAFRGVLVDKMSTAGFQPLGMKALIDEIEAA